MIRQLLAISLACSTLAQPNTGISVQLSVENGVVLPGEDLRVRILIRNSSERTAELPTPFTAASGTIRLQAWSSTDPRGWVSGGYSDHVAPPPIFSAGTITLAPGQEVERTVWLSEACLPGGFSEVCSVSAFARGARRLHYSYYTGASVEIRIVEPVLEQSNEALLPGVFPWRAVSPLPQGGQHAKEANRRQAVRVAVLSYEGAYHVVAAPAFLVDPTRDQVPKGPLPFNGVIADRYLPRLRRIDTSSVPIDEVKVELVKEEALVSYRIRGAQSAKKATLGAEVIRARKPEVEEK